MELFERVKQVAKIIGITDKELGAELGLKQSTFSGYLCTRRQNLLWPLLPRILERWPEISRQWLYFGEGPASFGRAYAQTGRPVGIRRIIGFAEQMAEDCGGNWGEALRVIIGKAKEEAENDPGSAEKIARLEARLENLERDLAREREISNGLTRKFVLGIEDAANTAKVAGGRE